MAIEYGAELWLEEDVGRNGLEEDVEKTGSEMHTGTSKLSSVPLATTREESGVCSRRFSIQCWRVEMARMPRLG